MFTVKDFIELPLFQEFKVISGHAGLDNTISSVNIMDNPDAIDWFSVGEILLTSGYFFSDSKELQNKIMHQLNDLNCPALCIKPQRYLGSIPKNMIKISNQLDLPIIELPYGFSFSKIMTRVNEYLTNEYDSLNRQSIDTAALFFDLSLHSGGLKDIGKTLSTLTESIVILSDESWNLLYHESFENGNKMNELTDHPDDFLTEIVDSLPYQSHQFQKPIMRFYETDRLSAYFIFMPVYFHGMHYGYITICNTQNILDSATTIALEQGAMAFALERIKNDEIIRARNRIRRDFIEELITGRIPSKAVLKTLATEHEVDLSLSYFANVFHFTFHDINPSNQKKFSKEIENPPIKKILAFLDNYKDSYHESSLFFSSRNTIVFLLGTSDNPTPIEVKKMILSKMQQITNNFPHVTLTAGIGQTVSHLFDIPTSYQEAEQTIKMMNDPSNLQVCHYDDFLVQHLLLSNLPTDSMRFFVDKVLGKLLYSTTNYPIEFLESLESLIKHQMNLAETARALYIHRNTLLYRKEKLEEILQVDFKNYEDVIKLDLALRFHHFLNDN